jgi:hypothetical protein
MITMLRQVVEHGGPAQAARAQLLIQELAGHPDDGELLDSARALIDAFLNDPYLVR